MKSILGRQRSKTASTVQSRHSSRKMIKKESYRKWFEKKGELKIHSPVILIESKVAKIFFIKDGSEKKKVKSRLVDRKGK